MISAILLGAGESKRMGVNKLQLPWRQKTVLEHCLDSLLRSNIQEVVIVLSDQTKEMRDRLKGGSLLKNKRIKVEMNRDYKKGMSTSVRRGLKTIDPRSDGILIALGDQPFLNPRTINALIRAFDQRRGDIIVPSFRGVKGHPVIFHRKYEKELLKLRGDTGGKPILLKYSKQIKTIPVRSEGVIKDIDTREEYQKALRMRRGRDEKRSSGKIGKRNR
jgi:molybdenum cofactor cytidylyltransferase